MSLLPAPSFGPIRNFVQQSLFLHRNDAFGCGWSVSYSCCMRPFRIVLRSPLPDRDLRVSQGIICLIISEFVPEPGIEAFAITTLPR